MQLDSIVSKRLVLGTAQFGLNYGIANRSGKVAMDQARRVLDLARENGVDTLDTAIGYGDSEARLGELGVSDFKIITKVPALPPSVINIHEWVQSQIYASLCRLNVDRLHGLLVHHAQDLFSPAGHQILQALSGLRDAGLVERIGMSVYAPSDLEPLHSNGHIGLVQAPMNVFDRRFADSCLPHYQQRNNVEFHFRSPFLQGLLLMPLSLIPEAFTPWRPLLERWSEWCREQSLTPLEGCLAHVRAVAPAAKIVVGCDSVEQFAQILESWRRTPLEAPGYLRSDDSLLVNPSLWTRA